MYEHAGSFLESEGPNQNANNVRSGSDISIVLSRGHNHVRFKAFLQEDTVLYPLHLSDLPLPGQIG